MVRNRSNSERGVALLLAMFALMIVTAVAFQHDVPDGHRNGHQRQFPRPASELLCRRSRAGRGAIACGPTQELASPSAPACLRPSRAAQAACFFI